MRAAATRRRRTSPPASIASSTARATVLLRAERAEIAGQRFGQHGHHAAPADRRCCRASSPRGRAPSPPPRSARRRRSRPRGRSRRRVVRRTRRRRGRARARIDRHEGQRAQVEARRSVGLAAPCLQLSQHGRRKLARQPVQLAERGEVELRVADAPEPLVREHAPAPLEAHRHDVARAEGRFPRERRARRRRRRDGAAARGLACPRTRRRARSCVAAGASGAGLRDEDGGVRDVLRPAPLTLSCVQLSLPRAPAPGPGGGIGRRARLRILCPQGRAGSTPVPGTTSCLTEPPALGFGVSQRRPGDGGERERAGDPSILVGDERRPVPAELPVLPVRDAVVFPGVTVPLVRRPRRSLAALDEAGARAAS